MNLSLLNAPATILSDKKQQELTTALIDLLIKAYMQENAQPESEGGSLEFEAHA
jgi:hypothetical protein